MTKKRAFKWTFGQWWTLGWTIGIIVIAVLLLFIKASSDTEIFGECESLNFFQGSVHRIPFEDGRNSFSIAHASQITLREFDTTFPPSDYNVHFNAKTIKFKEVTIRDKAQIGISNVDKRLTLSLSNVQINALIQLIGLTAISVRDIEKDSLIQINKSIPFETATISAKREPLDYNIIFYFNEGYKLTMNSLESPEIDFSKNIPGGGYINSLHSLNISDGTSKTFTVITDYEIEYKMIDRLEIECVNEKLRFTIFGKTKNLSVNGHDLRKSLYDHYIEPSGWRGLLSLLVLLLPYVLPILIKSV